MGETPEYDLSKGYLVFIIGDTDPIPCRPKDWNGWMNPLNVGHMAHNDECKAKGVGRDGMGKDSIRRVAVVFNPKIYKPTEPGDLPPRIEVYRNTHFNMVLELTGK